MLQFQFSRISFTKASKYVFLVSTQQQTKRTDVCFSWTSSPTFSENIQLEDSQIDEVYKIKACEATIDRKLKIVGFCIVERKLFNMGSKYEQQEGGNYVLFDDDMQLVQVVEGKDIVVGRCHLQVKKVDQVEKKSLKQSLAKSKVTDNGNLTLNKSNGQQKNPLYQQKQQMGVKSLQVSAVNSLAGSAANSPFNSARIPHHQQPFESPLKPLHSLSPQPYQKDLAQSQFQKQSQYQPKNPKNQQSNEQIDSDFEMKSDEEQGELQNDCSMRFFIHGGSNFYLGSSFSVQVVWCDKQCQTHYIKDKITPQWAESLTLLGNSEQYIVVNIIDERKNILQWTKFSLKNIRKAYPYHLKIMFREEYMGARPFVFLSFMREDLPRFSILDAQLRLIISNQGDNVRNPFQYVIIQSKQQIEIPTFFQLDLNKFTSFEQINKFIEGFEIGDYNWNYFIPLENGKREIILFKSQLNRNLSLFLVEVNNWALLFSNEVNTKKVQSLFVAQKRPQFQTILKQIYYHQQVHALGKATQIYSETNLAEGKIEDNNTWRTMTKNYILRNNLLNNSISNLEIFRKQISEKGQQLIKLKKVLLQVKAINTALKQKEKSTLVFAQNPKQRKQRLSAQSFKITDIQMMLYQKQAQLQFKKKRNSQMTQRMSSLSTMHEDTTELDTQLIHNAKLLLQQQQQIKLLILMRKQLPKQQTLIQKLQQIFQKQELDKNMNELLTKQQEKLNLIRVKKKEDLRRVYELVRERNQKENNNDVRRKVEKAEEELVRLNEVYAKLTGL